MKKKRRDELIGATNKLKRFVDKLRTDKMAMDAVFQKVCGCRVLVPNAWSKSELQMSAKLDGSQRELAELIDTSNTILKEKEEVRRAHEDVFGSFKNCLPWRGRAKSVCLRASVPPCPPHNIESESF